MAKVTERNNILVSVMAFLSLLSKRASRASKKLKPELFSPRMSIKLSASPSAKQLAKEEIFVNGDGFGDGGIWQRSIMRGDKCQPPCFSGVIYYDPKGNQISELPPKSPSASPLPGELKKSSVAQGKKIKTRVTLHAFQALNTDSSTVTFGSTKGVDGKEDFYGIPTKVSNGSTSVSQDYYLNIRLHMPEIRVTKSNQIAIGGEANAGVLEGSHLIKVVIPDGYKNTGPLCSKRPLTLEVLEFGR